MPCSLERYCAGDRGKEGQLGDGVSANAAIPVRVRGGASIGFLGRIDQASLGEAHSCALQEVTGEVFCWGKGDRGQLGDNTRLGSNLPVRVVMSRDSTEQTLVDIVQLSAGSEHTCALKKVTGEVFCWGKGDRGQLGNNTKEGSLAPVAVKGLESHGTFFGVKQISAGNSYTCALVSGEVENFSDGEVFCWGMGEAGRLGKSLLIDGHPNEEDSLIPTRVVMDSDQNPLSEVDFISLGSHHVCALKEKEEGSEILCWGKGANGRLGQSDGKGLGSSHHFRITYY